MGIQAANGNVVTVELDKLPAGSSPSLVLLDSLAPREGGTHLTPTPPPSELDKDESPAADVRKTRSDRKREMIQVSLEHDHPKNPII